MQSVVTLDVKPWDDKTDMVLLEKQVRTVEWDGLVWGLAKLVPVGYGINKLQINLVIGASASRIPAVQQLMGLNAEDDKVSLDELQEKLEEFEEFIMSTDVVAMQSKSQQSAQQVRQCDVFISI
jgi:elongation factor 1-beta